MVTPPHAALQLGRGWFANTPIGAVARWQIKDHGARVALTPAGTQVLIQAGHTVLVQAGAGAGSGFDDRHYVDAGATIVAEACDVWSQAELIIKVKEPLPSEYAYFQPGQVLFTYLHLAGVDPELTVSLVERRLPGVGDGGVHASSARCRDGEADLLIGAVLVVGARAPKVVSAMTVSTMRPGAVVVDVAIDQGGCIETARPTSHSGPTYTVDGVVHYAVPTCRPRCRVRPRSR